MITVYTFEDADGNDVGSYTTQNGADARDYAKQHSYNVIAIEYEFADSYAITEWQFANTKEETPR